MSLRVRVISIKLQKAGSVGAKGEILELLRRLCVAGGGRPTGAGRAGPAACLPGVRGLREARPPSLPLTELTAGHGEVPMLSY